MRQVVRSSGVRRPWLPGPILDAPVTPDSLPPRLIVQVAPGVAPGALTIWVGRPTKPGADHVWPPAVQVNQPPLPGVALDWIGKPLGADRQLGGVRVAGAQALPPGAVTVYVGRPFEAPAAPNRPWPAWIVANDPSRPGAVVISLRAPRDEPPPVLERAPFGPRIVSGTTQAQDARSYRVGYPFREADRLPAGVRVVTTAALPPGASALIISRGLEEGRAGRPILVVVPAALPPVAVASWLRSLRVPSTERGNRPIILTDSGLTPPAAQMAWLGRAGVPPPPPPLNVPACLMLSDAALTALSLSDAALTVLTLSDSDYDC